MLVCPGRCDRLLGTQKRRAFARKTKAAGTRRVALRVKVSPGVMAPDRTVPRCRDSLDDPAARTMPAEAGPPAWLLPFGILLVL